MAKAIENRNPAAGAIFRAGNSISKLEKAVTVQLVEVTGFDGYNAEDFARLIETETLLETMEIKK